MRDWTNARLITDYFCFVTKYFLGSFIIFGPQKLKILLEIFFFFPFFPYFFLQWNLLDLWLEMGWNSSSSLFFENLNWRARFSICHW